MTLPQGFQGSLRITGREGVLEVENPTLPHLGHRLRVRSRTVQIEEEVAGATSYDHQLEALAEALRKGKAPLTSGEDSVANLRVIDAAYAAAGLPLRGTHG
jgi:predicted dehydrogenase